ncbi:MAG: hypothetical protein K2X27_24990 [Candidatus Obscuribacterales bacterium]|nr:hypothetical protein [Candidatus Obscuribacterales bacterium]
MADNTEETKTAEQNSADENAPAEEEAAEIMSGDQSFVYWLVMLPFLALAGMFAFEYSKEPNVAKLINAGGSIVVGILVASCVNIFAQSNQNADESSEAKPEGSS